MKRPRTPSRLIAEIDDPLDAPVLGGARRGAFGVRAPPDLASAASDVRLALDRGGAWLALAAACDASGTLALRRVALGPPRGEGEGPRDEWIVHRDRGDLLPLPPLRVDPDGTVRIAARAGAAAAPSDALVWKREGSCAPARERGGAGHREECEVALLEACRLEDRPADLVSLHERGEVLAAFACPEGSALRVFDARTTLEHPCEDPETGLYADPPSTGVAGAWRAGARAVAAAPVGNGWIVSSASSEVGGGGGGGGACELWYVGRDASLRSIGRFEGLPADAPNGARHRSQADGTVEFACGNAVLTVRASPGRAPCAIVRALEGERTLAWATSPAGRCARVFRDAASGRSRLVAWVGPPSCGPGVAGAAWCARSARARASEALNP